MIRTWTPESEAPAAPTPQAMNVRRYFERLPRMRALIRQQQEHISDLKNAATTTTSRTLAV